MKRCHRCHEVKDLSEFNKNRAKKDGVGSSCRACMKIVRRDHYVRNRKEVIAKNTENKAARKAEVVQKLYEYLLQHPCFDCGNPDPRVLEFDHRERETKSFGISQGLTFGYSWSTLEEEAKKCDVRCANCHRIKTHNENKSFRSLWDISVAALHVSLPN